MRLISIACLVAVAIGACAGRTTMPAPQADLPQADIPMQSAQPPGTVPGERVIKTITLPKGQTPYDTPMPAEETVPVPPAVEVQDLPAPATTVSSVDGVAPGERVLKTVCLPKGERPDGMAFPAFD